MLQSILTSFPALHSSIHSTTEVVLSFSGFSIMYLPPPRSHWDGPRISLFCCWIFFFIFVIFVFHCVVFVCCCFCSRHYHDDADSRRLRWPTPEIDPRVTSRFVPHLCLLFVLQEKSHADYFHFRLGHISFISIVSSVYTDQTNRLTVAMRPSRPSICRNSREWIAMEIQFSD